MKRYVEHQEKHPFMARLEQARLKAGARASQHKDSDERRASRTELVAGELPAFGAATFAASGALHDVKMVLVVRSDLKMTTGKIASQVFSFPCPCGVAFWLLLRGPDHRLIRSVCSRGTGCLQQSCCSASSSVGSQ